MRRRLRASTLGLLTFLQALLLLAPFLASPNSVASHRYEIAATAPQTGVAAGYLNTGRSDPGHRPRFVIASSFGWQVALQRVAGFRPVETLLRESDSVPLPIGRSPPQLLLV